MLGHEHEVLHHHSQQRRLLLKRSSFVGHGVSVAVEYDDSIGTEVLAQVPPGFSSTAEAEGGETYCFREGSCADSWTLLCNDAPVLVDQPLATAAAFFGGGISWSLASAGDRHCYIHAGAVAVGTGAVLLPATSNAGKTTLTAALLRRGAAYLSDEYALIDDAGRVHPFERSLRFDAVNGVETLDPADLGAPVSEPVPPRLIVLVAYDPGAPPRLGERVAPAEALVALIDHTPSLAGAPEASLRRLRRVAEQAVTVRATRGDADQFAELLLSRFDELVESR